MVLEDFEGRERMGGVERILELKYMHVHLLCAMVIFVGTLGGIQDALIRRIMLDKAHLG